MGVPRLTGWENMEDTCIEVGFHPDTEDLRKRLGLGEDTGEAENFSGLLARVLPLTRPRAAHIPVEFEIPDAKGVIHIAQRSFPASPLLVSEGACAAYAYLATCGHEIFEYAQTLSDMTARFWMAEIMREATRRAHATVIDRIVGQAGSLAASEAWPISVLPGLFDILGDIPARCGVSLTDKETAPERAIAGVVFSTLDGAIDCRAAGWTF